MLAESWFIRMCADVVIDLSIVVMLGFGVDMLTGVEIVVLIAVLIAFGFVVEVGFFTGGICSARGITAEIKASDGLAVVTTDFEFAFPSPLEEPLLSCRVPGICLPMNVLDCTRALQDCKPSYHV